MFNIEQFIINNKIEYRKAGKNVGSGNINVCCIFCGEARFHLSLSLKKEVFSCWICGEKGNYEKFISKLLNISYIEAKQIVNPTSELKQILENRDKINEIKEIEKPKILTLPLGTYQFRKDKINIWQEIALKFLRNKYNITWNHIIDAKLHYCIKERYKNSIIIPFYSNGKLVNFISRTWDANAHKRYDNCPNELSLVNTKKLCYNYDNVIGKHRVLIVEGVFDAIKSGLDRTVALCGTEISQEQKNLLIGLKAEELLILFDNDPHLKTTVRKALDLADYLSPFVKTRVIKLPQGKDPGSMERYEIDNLIGG